MTAPRSEADDRFQELILLTARLTDVTRREIECLTLKKPREMAPLVEEKAGLSAHYARSAAALKRNPDFIRAATPELRAKLKESTTLFQKSLDELSRKLARVRQISEGLVRAVASDAAERRARPVGYGKDAAAPSPLSQPPLHLALNRVV